MNANHPLPGVAPATIPEQPRVLIVNFWGEVRADAIMSVERIIYATATRLRGFEVFVASRTEEPYVRQSEGVVFHTFKESKLRNRVYNKILNLKAFTFQGMVKIAKQLKPQIIHFHNRLEFVDRVVKQLGYRPRVICHYHRRLAPLHIPRCADLLLTVGEDTRQYILDTSKTDKKVLVVPNPLPATLLEMEKDLIAQRNAVPKILFPGGTEEHKGFREVAAVVKRLDQEGLNYELYIAGTTKAELLPASPHLHNLSFIPAEEYYQYLNRADIFLLPSWQEPFGVANIEAMYLRKIMVSTNNAGQRSYLNDSNAIIVQPGDPESLCQGLKKALALHASGERGLAEQARQASLAFLPERIAEQWAEVYQQVLSGA